MGNPVICRLLKTGVCLLLIAGWVGPAAAYGARDSAAGDKKIKTLKKYQRKSIADKVVRLLMETPFFAGRELPRKVVMVPIRVEGSRLRTTSEAFTNRVLDAILTYPRVFVLNQDFATDGDRPYALSRYDDVIAVRKQGIMLGADYYISGVFKSEPVTRENGKIQTHFVASLSVRDIRSDKLKAQVTYDYSAKKRKKRVR